jgi:hypothetical protein
MVGKQRCEFLPGQTRSADRYTPTIKQWSPRKWLASNASSSLRRRKRGFAQLRRGERGRQKCEHLARANLVSAQLLIVAHRHCKQWSPQNGWQATLRAAPRVRAAVTKNRWQATLRVAPADRYTTRAGDRRENRWKGLF